MSIQNISRRNVSDGNYQVLLQSMAASAGTLWSNVTDLAIAAFDKANKNTGSPDRIIQAYNVIVESGFTNLQKPFLKACAECCGVILVVDGAIVSGSRPTENWDKIKGTVERSMCKLEGKEGLRGFVVTRPRGSVKNKLTAVNQYQIATNGVAELMDKIHNIDSENAKVAALLPKLEALVVELKAEFDALEAKNLVKAMAPTAENDEPLSAVASL